MTSTVHLGVSLLSLSDLDPIRREDRKWSVWALVAYWFSDAFNAATWEFAASMLAIGLSYKDAIGIVATAFLIISVVITLNGAVGVLYHAPFPVLARAGWGFWGRYGTSIEELNCSETDVGAGSCYHLASDPCNVLVCNPDRQWWGYGICNDYSDMA